MKYEIEIPDGVIPEGYEPVAFQAPIVGEIFITSDGKHVELRCELVDPRLIIRKTWQWPEWLDADYIQWDGLELVWCAMKDNCRYLIFCGVLKIDPPPDKTRVYHNPRKAGGK